MRRYHMFIVCTMLAFSTLTLSLSRALQICCHLFYMLRIEVALARVCVCVRAHILARIEWRAMVCLQFDISVIHAGMTKIICLAKYLSDFIINTQICLSTNFYSRRSQTPIMSKCDMRTIQWHSTCIQHSLHSFGTA